jgi:hypothetical protein
MPTYKIKSLLYLSAFILCAWLYYQTGDAELLPSDKAVVIVQDGSDGPQSEFINL